MKRIVLDIGHGQNTFPPSKGVYFDGESLTGRPTSKWFEEYDFNSKVAILAREKLKEYDIEVLFTQQPSADDVPLNARINMANKWHKEQAINLLVSIHANAHYPGSSAKGYESYYWQGDEAGEKFCGLWHRCMKNTGMVDRGIKVSSNLKNAWYIIRKSPCTAVLLEHFFYTNYAELIKFTKPEWIEVLADNLVNAIIEYFKLSRNEEKKNTLTVNINGIEKEMDFIAKDNRNFVSIREIAESLGAAVKWDNVNKKVLISK